MLLTTADVGQDHVGDVVVSTLYFGLGAMYRQPVYWETSVVSADPTAADRDPHPDLGTRYATREAAVAGHAEVVAAVTALQSQAAS
jgi:hypothetical protein